MPTKAELETQVQTLESQLAAVRKGRERERQRVVDTAMKLAKRHGWCDVVRDALRNMGYGDYLPHRFSVESRAVSPGSRWVVLQIGDTERIARRRAAWSYRTRYVRSHHHRVVERDGNGQIVRVIETMVAR